MKVQGGMVESGHLAQVNHSKAIGIERIALLWIEKSSESSRYNNALTVPVYINEDRSDLLFSVKMEAKDEVEMLIRMGIAFFI